MNILPGTFMKPQVFDSKWNRIQNKVWELVRAKLRAKYGVRAGDHIWSQLMVRSRTSPDILIKDVVMDELRD